MVRIAHYVTVLIGVLPSIALGGDPTPPSPTSVTATQYGYKSPEEALRALRNQPGVVISTRPDGWTVADDRPGFTVWSFSPSGHPAHPAGIKRVLVQDQVGNVSVMMTAKCGGPRTACDKLVAEFQRTNDEMRERVQSQLKDK